MSGFQVFSQPAAFQITAADPICQWSTDLDQRDLVTERRVSRVDRELFV